MASKAGYLTKMNGCHPPWLRQWFAIEGEHLNYCKEHTKGLTAGGGTKQANATLRGTVILEGIQAVRISTFEAEARLF